jgi:hypothetical protein
MLPTARIPMALRHSAPIRSDLFRFRYLLTESKAHVMHSSSPFKFGGVQQRWSVTNNRARRFGFLSPHCSALLC